MIERWSCPFCGRGATILESNHHIKKVLFISGITPPKAVTIEIIECPSPQCKQFVLNFYLQQAIKSRGGSSADGPTYFIGDTINKWQLIPSSKAKPFPDYVPKAVLDDYQQACLIKDLSPKASATLARRCIQGMIRDFWKVAKKRLVDEIDAIKDNVEPLTWNAIDAVRDLGNIGAHMEKDVNLIIDIDPNEAELLVGLIEILIEDWYIKRHKQQEQLESIVQLAKQKKNQQATKKSSPSSKE
jgi:hypothetical protein